MNGVQLSLDHEPVKVVRSKLPVEQQWQLACAENPHLQRAVVDCARQLLDQGHRATANVIAEELRGRIRTVGDFVQVNNTWRRPMGQWLAEVHPELAVDIRSRRSPRG